MSLSDPAGLAAVLAHLARDAAAFDADVERYWNQEGVSQLEIFIDPDLYQYIQRWYEESRSFAQRVAALQATATALAS